MSAAGRTIALWALVQIVGLSACTAQRWPWVYTQRWPGPMEPESDPLPKGDVLPAGPEEVSVVRHADPARVRPAGLASSYPLRFFVKGTRLSAGSTVYTSSGGRLEVIWPSGNSLVLAGNSVGLVGSPSRGEACFLLRQVERALIDFKVADQVELVGGAVLRAKSGPIVIEMNGPEIVRIKNQSGSSGEVAFREATFFLDPGTVIDLPLVGVGGGPMLRDTVLTSRDGPGFPIRYSGAVQVEDEGSSVRVSATGEHALYALGVRVQLNSEEVAVLSGLEREPKTAPRPVAAPASAPSSPPAPSDSASSVEPAPRDESPPKSPP